MTKIIQISDPHIVPHGQFAYGQVDTATALASCVETVNRCLPEIGPVDLAIVTGDLTDFGTIEEYQRFRDIMQPLKIPYRAIPGNHDSVPVMRDFFADKDWVPASGPINWISEFPDLVLIALDTNVHEQAHGHLTDDSLAFLQNGLKAADGKPVIVATHHPPIMTGLEKMDIQNLRENRAFREILSSYQGELRLVCGHVHRNIVASFGGLICQIAPGVSHAVSMDLREGAPNCLTKEPGGFLLHELRNGILTHSIPVGAFDGPHLFYPND
ncbi:phosphodiesterase [Phaeobacter inhibens]|uniref:phosphodiesterase n=1 Tax=Phaeobacter inhibens TaxID=221822 RepID=UPI00076BB79E|nr:phosphodiesterase [Phaeobacter inhibens]KXF92387.1 metallophosphoesterase [Phaeobacter inhibens]WHP68763.1 phosphodiesterase [Phaeobacter inhibens]